MNINNDLLQNKMFVYRGDDYERLASFTSRLCSDFHQAQLLKNNNPVTESIKLDDGMCILYHMLFYILYVFIEKCLYLYFIHNVVFIMEVSSVTR